MKPNRSERGAGWFSVIFGLAVMAAVVFAIIKLMPPYIANYQFQDYIDDTARTATYNAISEEALKREILGRGKELGLPIHDRQLQVRKVRGGSVSIQSSYDVPVDLITRQIVLHFEPSAGNTNIVSR